MLKKISYHPVLVKLISFLRVRVLARKIYFYLFRPKNNILEVFLTDLSAKFYVKNPDDLRLVESVSGVAGEKKVMEAFLDLLNLGDVVYDVGANLGTYTVFLAKKVGDAGQVIAFEPEAKSLQCLKENSNLNNLSNITLIDKALGKENIQTNLYVGQTTGNFSVVKSYENSTKVQKIEIVAGDEFIGQHNIPVPKAVKIDVEGFEYEVLQGLQNTLKNPMCQVLCCEIHPGLFTEGVDEKIILGFIKALGFVNVEIFKREFSAYHIIATKL